MYKAMSFGKKSRARSCTGQAILACSGTRQHSTTPDSFWLSTSDTHLSYALLDSVKPFLELLSFDRRSDPWLRCQRLSRSWRVAHKPFGDSKPTRSVVGWAFIIILVDDGMYHDSLLVDGES